MPLESPVQSRGYNASLRSLVDNIPAHFEW